MVCSASGGPGHFCAARVPAPPQPPPGGDIGSFERVYLEKPFADVVFALPVGAVSGPVETGAGLHLIKRTG